MADCLLATGRPRAQVADVTGVGSWVPVRPWDLAMAFRLLAACMLNPGGLRVAPSLLLMAEDNWHSMIHLASVNGLVGGG